MRTSTAPRRYTYDSRMSRSRCFALALLLPMMARLSLAAPVTIPTFIAQPHPAPDATIAYGAAPSQAVDVYLPSGKGPHPVVVLIHGGCWTKGTAGREQLRAVARRLADRGVVVWSIGYRRVDEAGGAYPGIFRDIATAIDLIPANAEKYGLDTGRVVAVGHSAGAHLALWAASRGKLPSTSPLYAPHPFIPGRVIGLGGVGDLALATGIAQTCGASIIAGLLGPASSERPDRYADTSPARLLPPPIPVVMITGTVDAVTPPAYARTYVDEVNAAGGAAELVIVPDAAHFDVVTLDTPAWSVVEPRILAP